MAQDDEREALAGVNTVEMAVLEKVRMLYGVIAVILVIGLAWLGATAIAIYYAVTAISGAFWQAMATNVLASLILIAVTPVVFRLLLHSTHWYFVAFSVVASVILALAAQTNGGLRDFFLNLGCGLAFLLAIDYYVKCSFAAWVDRLKARTRQLEHDIQPVL
jgi:hypothetical protein